MVADERKYGRGRYSTNVRGYCVNDDGEKKDESPQENKDGEQKDKSPQENKPDEKDLSFYFTDIVDESDLSFYCPICLEFGHKVNECYIDFYAGENRQFQCTNCDGFNHDAWHCSSDEGEFQYEFEIPLCKKMQRHELFSDAPWE
jgi:hypothetical protein